MFAHDLTARDQLAADLNAPSLYDEFLRLLARRRFNVPAEVVERDWSLPYEASPGVVDVFRQIYADPERHWAEYETAEEFDVEDLFQHWWFRHMKTVERIIGDKRSTGGSSGVAFLRRALDLAFFPSCYRCGHPSATDPRLPLPPAARCPDTAARARACGEQVWIMAGMKT